MIEGYDLRGIAGGGGAPAALSFFQRDLQTATGFEKDLLAE